MFKFKKSVTFWTMPCKLKMRFDPLCKWPWELRNKILWCAILVDFCFVCLEFFHSYGDVTINGEGLQILTFARHSWPLSSEGSLACHTSWDTGHAFIMVISEDPWHSYLLTLRTGYNKSAKFLWPWQQC